MPSAAFAHSRRTPAAARSADEKRRASRASAFALVGGMAAVMWVSEILDSVGGLGLDRLGIEPREADGLIGIGAAPFLHAGLGHVAANTVPFLVLGLIIALGGLLRVVLVTVIVAVVGGLGTWLLGPSNSIHVGASGLVFGYAGYLLSRGFYTRRLRDFTLAALIALVWGGALLAGLLPEPGVSWQGHLFGALGGVVAGRLLSRPAADRRGRA